MTDNTQESMEILLTIDDTYLQPALVLIHSIFQNNPKQIINIHIMHCGGLSNSSIKKMDQFISKRDGKLSTYYVDLEWLSGLTWNWNKIVMLKLYAWEILRDTDKVLYLDADTLVIGKLKDLWNMDLGESYFAGVHITKYTEYHNYTVKNKFGSLHINAGTIVFNLQQLRKDNVDWKEYFIQNFMRLITPDESTICGLWCDKVLYISEVWNYVTDKLHDLNQNPIILHFMKKPWVPGPYQNTYLQYCDLLECQDLSNNIKKSILPVKRLNAEQFIDNWLMFEIDCSDYFERFFIDKGYKKIVIYGIGRIGKLLTYKILKCKNVEIAYYLDAFSDKSTFFGKTVLKPDLINLQNVIWSEGVDAVVVTVFEGHFDIIKHLKESLSEHIEIMSIAEIVYY